LYPKVGFPLLTIILRSPEKHTVGYARIVVNVMVVVVVKVKVKQSRYRPGVAQRVPES
jgi:hypothetical protein